MEKEAGNPGQILLDRLVIPPEMLRVALDAQDDLLFEAESRPLSAYEAARPEYEEGEKTDCPGFRMLV